MIRDPLAHPGSLRFVEIIGPPLHHRTSVLEAARGVIGRLNAPWLVGKLMLDPVAFEAIGFVEDLAREPRKP